MMNIAMSRYAPVPQSAVDDAGEKPSRIVGKGGQLRITRVGIPSKRMKYLQDAFNTLANIPFSRVLVILLTSLVGSWSIFATLYWFLGAAVDESCLETASTFAEAFVLSVDTQTTIGFGNYSIKAECGAGILVMITQCLFGILLDSFIVAILVTKISQPGMRHKTIMFSQRATVASRDGVPCLMVRVGDIRQHQLLEAHVRMILFRTRNTAEGEEISMFAENLSLERGEGWLFMAVPTVICHPIDESSPLHGVSQLQLAAQKMEIIIVLEGVTTATSATVQARQSYLASEILWGRRFVNMVMPERDGGYRINFSLFNDTEAAPLHSDSIVGGDTKVVTQSESDLQQAADAWKCAKTSPDVSKKDF